MSSKTDFLKLTKPDALDYYSVQEFNDNAEVIDKKAKELSDNANADRKRVDNLLLSNTIDTQEIGKRIFSGFGTVFSAQSDSLVCGAFSSTLKSDSDFIEISDERAAKILKSGTYYIRFSGFISTSSDATGKKFKVKLTKSGTLKIDGGHLPVDERKLTAIGSVYTHSIDFIISIEEGMYIYIEAESGTGTLAGFAYSVEDIEITAIDWIGKQSGAASETADIRLGADGNRYKTAGEAVRMQFENVDKKSNCIKEFARSDNEGLTEYLLGIPNLCLLKKISNGDNYTVYQSLSNRNKVFIINDSMLSPELEIADLSVYVQSEKYTDINRLIAGSDYQIYGATSDVKIKFLNANNGIIDTVFCNYTMQKFTIPDECKKIKIYVELADSEIFLDIFICKYFEETICNQIDTLQKQIDKMQEIITKLVTAPQLVASENEGLQIKYNSSDSEEG